MRGNGRGTDDVIRDFDFEGVAATGDERATASSSNKRTLTFNEAAELVQQASRNRVSANPTDFNSASKPVCYGCNYILFANPRTRVQDSKVSTAVGDIVNLVSLESIYKSIHKQFEKLRHEEAVENGGHFTRHEWTLEMIKEHFEEHIIDSRIQDRLCADSLLFAERLLRNSIYLEDSSGNKIDVNEKLYKLWLATVGEMKRLKVFPVQSIFDNSSGNKEAGAVPELMGTAGGPAKRKRPNPKRV